MWGVGVIINNANGSSSKVGVESVNEGEQRSIDDLAGCIQYALQSLLAGGSAASIPYSDAPVDEHIMGGETLHIGVSELKEFLGLLPAKITNIVPLSFITSKGAIRH